MDNGTKKPRMQMPFERELKHIDLEITKKCNLSCIHCSARSNVKGRELSLKEIKIVLDKGSSLGLKNVGFTGGEPLLQEGKLVNSLRYCKRTLNLRTHIHTNGTLLSCRAATKLAELVDEISIPILGSIARTHDKITSVKGSLKAAKSGLIRLLAQRANVWVYLVPMRSNFKETTHIIEKAHKMGCTKFRLLSLAPTGRACGSFEALSLSRLERKWLGEELNRTGKELNVDIDAGFCTRQDYPQISQLKGHQSCLAAEDRVHVDAFGEIFPCTASSGLEVFSGGNIRTHAFDLANLWETAPVFQFFRFFHNNPPKKCQSCFAFPQCMGGCRVMMFHRYRNFTVAKPDCKPLTSLS